MSAKYDQVFRRMNLDADVKTLRPGDHRKMYNSIQVQPQSSTVPLDGVIANMFGNALVANSDLAGGTNKIIGGIEDRAGNRYFFAVYNSTASNNTIYQYKSGVITRVLRSSLFAWSSSDFVDMDIVGDILILTNNGIDVLQINVVKAIAGVTYTPLYEQITLIKRPPHGVLTLTPLYDIAYSSNFVSGNYFQFFHRYIYEDNQKSVFGGASASSDSWVLPSTTVEVMGVTGTNYALAGTTAIDHYGVSVGARVLLKNQTDPKENGIWVIAAGAWARSTDADSDAELRALNIYIKFGDEGSGSTWKNSNTSAITIGVTSIVFEPTEGPNAIDVTTATADIPATAKQVEYAVKINGSNEYTVYRIDKTPLSGATHRFYNNVFFYTVPDSETVKWSDAIPVTSKALRVVKNRLFLFNNKEGYTHTTTTSVALTATAVAFTDTRAFRHHKDGGTYNVGICFFDFAGRFVGGLHCDAQIVIPYRRNPFSTIASTPPYKIAVDLTGIATADIPLQAVDFAVVVSNLTNKSFFIRYATADFFYYTNDSSGARTYTKTYAGNITGTAIDISTLAYEGIGYTFQPGDRIRISPADSLGYSTLTNYVFVDVEIVAQEGRFILTRTLGELGGFLFGAPNNFLFEIYTPKTPTIEPFFEVGEKYPINFPGNVGGTRAFSVTSITPTGDTSSVLRNIYGVSGSYSSTAPFSNDYRKYLGVKLPFEAMNSNDKKFDQWIKPGARSIIKSVYDPTQQEKKNSIRFGQLYDQSSQVLELNTFQALDEQALPIENGPGTGLAVAGEVLVAIHEIESTAVYVGQGFINTSEGNRFLAKTESVIGDVRKYLGGHGSINQASIVSREGVVYFLDARKGVIVRRSQDGLTVISKYADGGIAGYVSALCTAHVALGSTSRIIGGWDPQYNCYVLSFIDTAGPSGYTLYWHEKSNSWCCLNDMRPEFWGQLGQNQIAFLSGGLWTQTVESNYNKFFGVQYNRRLEFEIGNDSLEKIWEAIEVDIESIYSTAGTNEPIVLLYHINGGTLQNQINYLDFKQIASTWRSSFFRNMNDANYLTTTASKYKSFHNTRGQSAFLVITYNGTDKNIMKSISVFFRPSLNSTP